MRLFILLIIPLLILGCADETKNIEVIPTQKSKDTVINSLEERANEIEKYTALLYKDSLIFNTHHANNLLKAYDEYIKHHSFQAISKLYQFKAGELAKALNKPNEAIKYFNDLLARDPDHEKAPIALFYKAMIIGDMLHEDEQAIATYQEFIDKYPKHTLTESARQSIKLQGKSLEDIVADFEKNS